LHEESERLRQFGRLDGGEIEFDDGDADRVGAIGEECRRPR
jgi:hypothetical protein